MWTRRECWTPLVGAVGAVLGVLGVRRDADGAMPSDIPTMCGPPTAGDGPSVNRYETIPTYFNEPGHARVALFPSATETLRAITPEEFATYYAAWSALTLQEQCHALDAALQYDACSCLRTVKHWSNGRLALQPGWHFVLIDGHPEQMPLPSVVIQWPAPVADGG